MCVWQCERGRDKLSVFLRFPFTFYRNARESLFFFAYVRGRTLKVAGRGRRADLSISVVITNAIITVNRSRIDRARTIMGRSRSLCSKYPKLFFSSTPFTGTVRKKGDFYVKEQYKRCVKTTSEYSDFRAACGCRWYGRNELNFTRHITLPFDRHDRNTEPPVIVQIKITCSNCGCLTMY